MFQLTYMCTVFTWRLALDGRTLILVAIWVKFTVASMVVDAGRL